MDHEEVEEIPTSLENPNFPARARQVVGTFSLPLPLQLYLNGQSMSRYIPRFQLLRPQHPHVHPRVQDQYVRVHKLAPNDIERLPRRACVLVRSTATLHSATRTRHFSGRKEDEVSVKCLDRLEVQRVSMDEVLAQSKLESQDAKAGEVVRGDAAPSQESLECSGDAHRAAVRLCRTMVHDGAVSGTCTTHGAATRRDRQSAGRDEVGAALYLHALSKTKKKISARKRRQPRTSSSWRRRQRQEVRGRVSRKDSTYQILQSPKM